MALDAGSVFATLGGRFNPAGFVAFDGAMKKSKSGIAAFESGVIASTGRSNRALSMMGATARGGALAGVVALSAGVVALGVKSAKTFAGFQKELNNFRAVSGATKGDMDQLEASVRKLGVSSGLGATKAAQAATELAKGGLSVKQILDGGLNAAIQLAVAGDLELADAASFTANALDLFGLKGKDATKIADGLATAANQTTADVSDFGMALTQGGSAAKAAGLSFNETMTALEALAAIGIKNSDAGTSLKTALLQLINPTKKQKEAADALGLSFVDNQGNFKGLADVSEMLRSKTEGMTKAQRLAAFETLAGTDGVRTLLALYDAGPQKLDSFSKGLSKQGTAAEVSKKKQEGLGGSVNKLKALWQEFELTIGKAIAPGAAKAVDTLAAKLREWQADGTMKEIGAQFERGMAVINASLPVLLDLSEILVKLGGGAFKGLKVSIDFALGLFSGFIEGLKGIAEAWNATAGALGVAKIDTGRIQNDLDNINKLRDRVRGVPDKKKTDIQTTARQALPGVTAYLKVLQKVPAKTRTTIQADDAAAQGRLAKLIGKLAKVDGSKSIAQILANSKNADDAANRVKARLDVINRTRALATVALNTGGIWSQIAGVRAALTSIPDETVNVNFRKLKPFAAGTKTSGPQLAWIGEGGGPEYVIPTEPRYRGRGVDLWMMAGQDLGIPGFASGKAPKGKKPAKKPARWQPAKLDPLSLPVSEFEGKRNDAQQQYERLVGDVSGLEQDITGLENQRRARGDKNSRRDAARQLPIKRASLKKAKADLAKAKATRDELVKELKDAKAYADKIGEQSDLVELARQDMELADKNDDQAGYDTAKGKRGAALAAWRNLIKEALRHVDPKTAYARELLKAIGQIRLDEKDLPGTISEADRKKADDAKTTKDEKDRQDESDAKAEAERFASTGMTLGEVDELDQIEKDIALAELTPGLDDDRTQAQRLSDFRDRILGLVQTRPGVKTTAITAAAQAARQAHDQLSGLTGGDADLTAQLDQEKARRASAERDAAISRAAVAAFGGPGDIGTGRGSAYQAAGGPLVQVDVNAMHPGDPKIWSEVASAAVAGIDLQGSVNSPRVQVGP